jgi:hypothetical protein
MEWYEIIGVVVVWISGVWIRGKIYEFRRDYYKNGSWRKK